MTSKKGVIVFSALILFTVFYVNQEVLGDDSNDPPDMMYYGNTSFVIVEGENINLPVNWFLLKDPNQLDSEIPKDTGIFPPANWLTRNNFSLGQSPLADTNKSGILTLSKLINEGDSLEFDTYYRKLSNNFVLFTSPNHIGTPYFNQVSLEDIMINENHSCDDCSILGGIGT